ncbi:MAG TPA: OstA-like protein, partial [Ferruginibacter sp.]|nr:OstA-like protein [Ferruginibacter sp.]
MRSNSHTLRRMRHCRKLLILLLMSFPAIFGYAQQVVTLTADSTKIIQIVQARSLRQKTIDSATVLQTLAGNAIVRQGNTILHGDSIVLNQLTGIAEVFGNVHINDADTVHTYAQYLKYIGAEQVAYLKKSVRLTDGKATLTTEDLTYNIQTGIANYQEGGKVVNGKTVLTSRSATYYSDSRDVFFKENVHLVDPKYDMRADSLRYNTYVKEAYFISPTHIVSDDGVLDTRSGTYNL